MHRHNRGQILSGSILLLLLLILMAVPARTVRAASETSEDSEVTTGWVKTTRGYQYYDETGKLVKPGKNSKYKIFTVGTKSYAVNSKGYQVYGWRKIDGKYYYFNYRYGKKGYMLKDTTVNAITLKPKGTAKFNGKRYKRKARILAHFSEWMDEITEDIPLASRKEKLKASYDYLRRLRYKNVGKLRRNDPNRDLWCCEYVYSTHTFDCHTAAATFAYFALTLGYTDVKWHTMIWNPRIGNQHSFVQINGKYYDPSLGRHNLKSYKLYAMKKPYHVKQIKWTMKVNKV